MKALLIYWTVAMVAVNVAVNAATNTAEGVKQIQEQRVERLCKINARYCA